MSGDVSTGGFARFPTTHRSAVAGVRSGDASERERSWRALVLAYFRPTYKHLRRRWRKSREDAEDLTQGFFARALEKEFFADYDPSRARFRTFLRVGLDRFASNEAKAASRQKRGGDVVVLDFDAAEAELARTPDVAEGELFDLEWRRSLFAMAVDALREAWAGTDRGSWLTILERYDLCEEAERPTYEALGRELGLPVTTVTNRLASARRELRRFVLEKLAEVTASDDEYRSEARLLFGADVR